MGPDEDFETYRTRITEKWEAKGYWSAEELLDSFNLTFEDLQKKGLLKKKLELQENEVLHYDLTSKGKRYFKHLKEAQLLLIKNEDLTKIQHELGI